MRALCRACLRPRLEHSKGRHYSYAPVRRNTFTPSRRKLTFCDAFAILLAPVLTTAFVLDATAKERRSKEWDRQIAELQRQTDELNRAHQERWVHVQRRSVRHGATVQRRMYSSQARALRSDPDEDELCQPTQHLSPEATTGDLGLHPVTEHATSLDHTQTADLSPPPDRLKGLALHNAQQSVQKFDQLLATRLALQLILHLRTGRSAVYQLMPDDMVYDLPFPVNLEQLVRQISAVNRSIHRLRVQQYPYDLVQPRAYRSAQLVAAAELDAALEKFQTGSINLPGLITTYSTIISHHRCGLPLDSYVKLHRKLHRFRHMALCAISESAIIDGRQSLDRAAISTILRRCATTADAYRLQEFLTRVVKHDRHPRARVPWAERRVSGMRLSLPIDSNNDLIANLIHATTHCQQTHLAEAYANYMFQNDANIRVRGGQITLAFSCLFQHFSFTGDWIRGQQWMDKFIHWLHRALDVRVVLLRMLELCVACDKQHEYHLLLEIIIRLGITTPEIYHDKPVLMSPRIQDIRSDWKRQLLAHESDSLNHETSSLKADLQGELQSWYQRLRPDPSIANPGDVEQHLRTSRNRSVPNKTTVDEKAETAAPSSTAPVSDGHKPQLSRTPNSGSFDKMIDLNDEQESHSSAINKTNHSMRTSISQYRPPLRHVFHPIGYQETTNASASLIQRQPFSTKARRLGDHRLPSTKEGQVRSHIISVDLQEKRSEARVLKNPLQKTENLSKPPLSSSPVFDMDKLSHYTIQLTSSVEAELDSIKPVAKSLEESSIQQKPRANDIAATSATIPSDDTITPADATLLQSFVSSTEANLRRSFGEAQLREKKFVRYVVPHHDNSSSSSQHIRARIPNHLDRLAAKNVSDKVSIPVRRVATKDQETFAAKSRREAGFGRPGSGIRSIQKVDSEKGQ